MPLIRHPNPNDRPAIDGLIARSFGSGRERRAASILRRDAVRLPELCFVTSGECGPLCASVECWRVWLAPADGSAPKPLVLLGPLAVEPSLRGQGFGIALVEAVCAAADEPIVLIGDEAYYGRFGFSAAQTGGWALPGEYEPERLLARGDAGLPRAGRVVAAIAALAPPALVTPA
ncbi:MAG: N-acetyltransferase [Sphingomonadaceae bacterium]|nr:N-acetyltransferase [Sphingomonadaceae bacterium]